MLSRYPPEDSLSLEGLDDDLPVKESSGSALLLVGGLAVLGFVSYLMFPKKKPLREEQIKGERPLI